MYKVKATSLSPSIALPRPTKPSSRLSDDILIPKRLARDSIRTCPTLYTVSYQADERWIESDLPVSGRRIRDVPEANHEQLRHSVLLTPELHPVGKVLNARSWSVCLEIYSTVLLRQDKTCGERGRVKDEVNVHDVVAQSGSKRPNAYHASRLGRTQISYACCVIVHTESGVSLSTQLLRS